LRQSIFGRPCAIRPQWFHASGHYRHSPLPATTAIRRAQERSLFVDINANQEGLNTSYLAIMQSKLTPEQLEIKSSRQVDRKRLTDDSALKLLN
jgi:hypothetical protein